MHKIDKFKVMFASLSVAFENHTNKQFRLSNDLHK